MIIKPMAISDIKAECRRLGPSACLKPTWCPGRSPGSRARELRIAS